MRVFLDANLLFSASKSDGAIRLLIRLAIEAGHELWVVAFVLEEARPNLALKYPEALSKLDELRADLRVAPTGGLRILEDCWARILPEKDRPVLEAAIQAGCEIQVTGDRAHFGTLYGRTIQGVVVRSQTTFAQMLRR